MSISKFKNHQIVRNCDKHYDDYHNYKPYLLEDFSHRCCYCNIHEQTLELVPFQIDHFIPKKRFEGKRDELLTQYNNLMLSCPKCNRAKSDQYVGDLMSPTIENQLFYNPDKTNYNDIFYRNELGGISSDDEKGKDMIKRLKLYRPLHNYAWLLEKLDHILTNLDSQIALSDGEKKEKLEEMQGRLAVKYRKMRKHFVAAYREI